MVDFWVFYLHFCCRQCGFFFVGLYGTASLVMFPGQTAEWTVTELAVSPEAPVTAPRALIHLATFFYLFSFFSSFLKTRVSKVDDGELRGDLFSKYSSFFFFQTEFSWIPRTKWSTNHYSSHLFQFHSFFF